MILRTRLQWLLAGSTVVFTLAAIFSALAGGSNNGKESTKSTTTTVEAATTTTIAPKTYVVNSGDSLSSIASTFGVDLQALVDLNGIVDVDKINAGDVLKLPPPTTTTSTETTTTVAETSRTS